MTRNLLSLIWVKCVEEASKLVFRRHRSHHVIFVSEVYMHLVDLTELIKVNEARISLTIALD